MPTFRIVWLLRNLSLDGKLCLHDDKMLRLCKFTISRQMLNASIENVTHKPQAVSDWLNPPSSGTMSAFGYIGIWIETTI